MERAKQELEAAGGRTTAAGQKLLHSQSWSAALARATGDKAGCLCPQPPVPTSPPPPPQPAAAAAAAQRAGGSLGFISATFCFLFKRSPTSQCNSVQAHYTGSLLSRDVRFIALGFKA